MTTKELYLKTLFCCCACDGEIAPEEIKLIKALVDSESVFTNEDIEGSFNEYIKEINQQGKAFLRGFLDELSDCELSDDEQLTLVELAINMLEADNQVVYSEVVFFKKIRARLSITDEKLLAKLPDKEDYFLPDLMADDKEEDWVDIRFDPIDSLLLFE